MSAVLLFGAVLFVGVAPSRSAEPPEATPQPDFPPEQVVSHQLEALQNNGPADQGIAICYRFAAPVNRLYTGPLPRFVQMLHSPEYAPLLNHRMALIGPARIQANHALVLVTLADLDRHPAAYMFLLAKQDMPPYQGCWMTTGVTRIELAQASSPPPAPADESGT